MNRAGYAAEIDVGFAYLHSGSNFAVLCVRWKSLATQAHELCYMSKAKSYILLRVGLGVSIQSIISHVAVT